MKFKPTFDVWPLSQAERAAIQPGQWVTAGPRADAPRGQYLGQKKSGVDVVAWHRSRSQYFSKRQALRAYAIAK